MKRLKVWRTCSLCQGAGRVDDGLEAPWNCSACNGTGVILGPAPIEDAGVQRAVRGYTTDERNRLVSRWAEAERKASALLLAGDGEGGAWWLERHESMGRELAAMEARQ